MWVSFMIFTNLSMLWLRSKGYFQEVNESHMHDLGKWMFAISMLVELLVVEPILAHLVLQHS